MSETGIGSSSAHLCSVLGISRPVLSAPMAKIAGGRLAAAVSKAGGLGFIDGGHGEQDWLSDQLGEAGGARI